MKKHSDSMVNSKDSEELSSEDLAKMTGGAFPGTVCPSYVDKKVSKKTKLIDNGRLSSGPKGPGKGDQVSGDVVN